MTPFEGDLHHFLVKLLGFEHQTAVITASGTSDSLIEVASSFSRCCCALRPAALENLNLSTFQFDFHARISQSRTNIVVKLQLLRQAAGDKRSCPFVFILQDIHCYHVLDVSLVVLLRKGSNIALAGRRPTRTGHTLYK